MIRNNENFIKLGFNIYFYTLKLKLNNIDKNEVKKVDEENFDNTNNLDENDRGERYIKGGEKDKNNYDREDNEKDDPEDDIKNSGFFRKYKFILVGSKVFLNRYLYYTF